MKTTMRKSAALLISAALLTGAFAGCSSSETASSGAASGTDSAAADEVTTLKIMGIDKTRTVDSGEVSLSDWAAGGSTIWDTFVAELKERGIALELDLIPEDQYQTVCQTQLTAGIDADIINLTPWTIRRV